MGKLVVEDGIILCDIFKKSCTGCNFYKDIDISKYCTLGQYNITYKRNRMLRKNEKEKNYI